MHRSVITTWIRAVLFTVFAVWDLLVAAGTAAFTLDLRQIKSGLCRTETCAVAFSSTFTLDLTGRIVSVESGIAIGSSSGFTLDLREVKSAIEDGIATAFATGFVLDLRSINDNDPVPSSCESTSESSCFAFVLDLRAIKDSDASAYATSTGFKLDLRGVESESGTIASNTAVVWTSSAGFELDLRDLDPVTMCANVVFLYSNTFELDLRKITVEGVIILPEDITGGKDIKISEDWVNKELDERFGAGTGEKFGEMYGYDLKQALTKPTSKCDAHGNELLVWHDYVAGTDPTNPESVFQARVEMVDGTPIITWSPALNGEGVQTGARRYRIFATDTLGGNWVEVAPDAVDTCRFFSVTVEMP